MTWYGGVDLGATNITAVVGDESGVVVGQAERPTPTGPDGAAVSAAVVETLEEAATDAGMTPEELVGVGVGSIGPLDTAAGAVSNSPNLAAGIEYVPLVAPLTERFSVEVTLYNDAVAGVIGERFYADQPPADMAYVTISSGIGAGVAVDGNVLAGWDGNAAEVGHWMVEPGGLSCGCGVNGHWEAYCSGTNIPQHARHIHETEDVETALPLDAPEFDAAALFAAANEDPLADRTIESCAAYNAIGVANLVHAYAPRVVHIGGAVATNNPELVVDPLRERVPEQVISNVPDIRIASLGDSVVVRGALAAAITASGSDRAMR